MITFLLSIFSSSFGMSKFLLSGPISFLPTNSLFDGLVSIPFFCLFWINIMFGIRIVCTECAISTSYRKQEYDSSLGYGKTTSIDPLVPEEYRLVAYLLPCIFPFVINFFRMFTTYISKAPKQRQYSLARYPQYLLACLFTPFMFEGYKPDASKEVYSIRIWKLGTILNAFYIGCLPQCLLLGMEYYKGVPSWDFVGTKFMRSDRQIMEGNDALFKHRYGNTLFACISFVLCFILILTFFCSDKLFRKCGLHCKVFDILCCPSPQGCLSYNNKIRDSTNDFPMNQFYEIPDYKTGAYFYNQHEIKWLFRKSRRNESSPNLEV